MLADIHDNSKVLMLILCLYRITWRIFQQSENHKFHRSIFPKIQFISRNMPFYQIIISIAYQMIMTIHTKCIQFLRAFICVTDKRDHWRKWTHKKGTLLWWGLHCLCAYYISICLHCKWSTMNKFDYSTHITKSTEYLV